jgi:hypothetical protein
MCDKLYAMEEMSTRSCELTQAPYIGVNLIHEPDKRVSDFEALQIKLTSQSL